MLEGVERLIDLVGFRSSGLSGATGEEVATAVRRGDAARLAATDGHFAVAVRDGITVRLARTHRLSAALLRREDVPRPVPRGVGPHRHALRLVPVAADRLAVRSRLHADDSRRTTWWRSIRSAVPTPCPATRASSMPPVGTGPADVAAAGEAYVRAALRRDRRWLSRLPAGRAGRRGLLRRRGQHVGRGCWPGGPPRTWAATRTCCGRSRSTSAAARTRRRPKPWRAALGLAASWERVAVPESEYDLRGAIARNRGLPPARRGVRGRGAVPAARGPRAPSALRYLLDGDGGDENLKSYPLEDSDLDALQRAAEPAALPGRLGHRRDQAQPDLLGRPLPRLRPHLRAGARFGFTAFSPYTTGPPSRRPWPSRSRRCWRAIGAPLLAEGRRGARRRARR